MFSLLFIADSLLFVLAIFNATGAGVGEVFSLDAERTIPAFYQLVKLGSVGVVGVIVAWRLYLGNVNRVRILQWLGFGVMMMYVAIDEWFELHERVLDVVGPFFSGLGWFENTVFYWVIVFFPLIAIGVFVLYRVAREVLRSSSTIARWFWIGTGCFVGVVVFEFVGGLLAETAVYVPVTFVEELLELIGASCFLIGVSRYLKQVWTV